MSSAQPAPPAAGALFEAGLAGQRHGRLAEAERCYRELLRREPGHAGALSQLGAVLFETGRDGEGLERLRRAAEMAPGNPAVQLNLGLALLRGGDLAGAVAACRRAAAIRPDAESEHRLGQALQLVGDYEAAVAAYDRAVALDPAHAGARTGRGMIDLLHDRYAVGWAGYEWRLHLPGREARFAGRAWSGREDLAGRALLLHAEQGLGDTIQFLRYVPLAAARGARILLGIQPPLRSLVPAGWGHVIGRGEALPGHDLQTALPSLAHAFATTPATIPAAPYLAADPGLVAAWRAALPPEGFRVGLVWAGGPGNTNDRNRSLSLSQLAPLFALPGIRFVGLQPELHPADAAALAGIPGFTRPARPIRDFADTAAIIASLDLVITVDTSVAHLAGALGHPVWTLLPAVPSWRWGLGRAETPWYPAMRLFRQAAPEAWDEVVAQVAAALARAVAGDARFLPLDRPGES